MSSNYYYYRYEIKSLCLQDDINKAVDGAIQTDSGDQPGLLSDAKKKINEWVIYDQFRWYVVVWLIGMNVWY